MSTFKNVNIHVLNSPLTEIQDGRNRDANAKRKAERKTQRKAEKHAFEPRWRYPSNVFENYNSDEECSNNEPMHA